MNPWKPVRRDLKQVDLTYFWRFYILQITQKKLAQSEMNKVIDYRTRNERFLAEHTNSNLEKQQ